MMSDLLSFPLCKYTQGFLHLESLFRQPAFGVVSGCRCVPLGITYSHTLTIDDAKKYICNFLTRRTGCHQGTAELSFA